MLQKVFCLGTGAHLRAMLAPVTAKARFGRRRRPRHHPLNGSRFINHLPVVAAGESVSVFLVPKCSHHHENQQWQCAAKAAAALGSGRPCVTLCVRSLARTLRAVCRGHRRNRQAGARHPHRTLPAVLVELDLEQQGLTHLWRFSVARKNGNVDKNVLPAVLGLDEPKPARVVPFFKRAFNTHKSATGECRNARPQTGASCLQHCADRHAHVTSKPVLGHPYADMLAFSSSRGLTVSSQVSMRFSVSMPCVRASMTRPTKRPSTMAAEWSKA